MEEKNNLKTNINIDKNLKIVKHMLGNIVEIMTLLKPLIEKVLKSKDAEKYKKNGTFERTASLFGEISEQCKKLDDFSFTADFLRNLKN